MVPNEIIDLAGVDVCAFAMEARYEVTVEAPLISLGYKDYAPVAVDSGNVAVQYGITREEQDKFAFASHQNYGKAWKGGFFSRGNGSLYDYENG